MRRLAGDIETCANCRHLHDSLVLTTLSLRFCITRHPKHPSVKLLKDRWAVNYTSAGVAERSHGMCPVDSACSSDKLHAVCTAGAVRRIWPRQGAMCSAKA